MKIMNTINVTRSSMPSYDEYCETIKPIFESRWLTNTGPLHDTFSKQVSAYLGVENTALFTNGHLALCCGIKALGLTGEVITTPFTFASTTHAIVDCGLTPVFCDVEPETYTIDTDKLEELITDKTSAIIPVHVYGNICDVEKIEKIAKKHNIKVIYDAAHAFGIKVNEKGIGSFGDMSMFSFHATKVFNTIEGGGLTYNDISLTDKISSFRNFGLTGPESVDMVGTNAKMNEFQAAMGICNLRHIDDEIKKREQVENRYRMRLEGVKGIKLCPVQKNISRNYAYFPVVFDKDLFGKNRDEVAEYLKKENIFARKYFYPLTNEFSCYKGLFKNETPVAEKIAKNILTLPMYADLTVLDVDKICDIILK